MTGEEKNKVPAELELHCLRGRLGHAGEAQGSGACGHRGIYKQCRAISHSRSFQETGMHACSTLYPSVWRLIKQVAYLPVSPEQIKWPFSVRLALALSFLIHKI